MFKEFRICKGLIKQSKDKNICQEWLQKMKKSKDLGFFCNLFFRGDDWVLKHNYPTKKMLEFMRGTTQNHGIFINQHGEVKNPNYNAFLLNSTGVVACDGWEVSRLIVRHDSVVEVYATDNAIVNISAVDNAKIIVHAEKYAQVLVFDYGDNVQVVGDAKVIKSTFKKDE